LNIKLLKVTIKNRAAYLKPSQKLTFSTQKKKNYQQQKILLLSSFKFNKLCIIKIKDKRKIAYLIFI
jgi:hypothetical protein